MKYKVGDIINYPYGPSGLALITNRYGRTGYDIRFLRNGEELTLLNNPEQHKLVDRKDIGVDKYWFTTKIEVVESVRHDVHGEEMEKVVTEYEQRNNILLGKQERRPVRTVKYWYGEIDKVEYI